MIVPIVLISIFVLVYVCIVFALDHTGFREMRFVLALPVSVLCVLSLTRGGGHSQDVSMIDTVLIPYAALACSMVFVVVLLLLSRIHFWAQKYVGSRKIRKTSIAQEDRGLAGRNARKRFEQDCEDEAIGK